MKYVGGHEVETVIREPTDDTTRVISGVCYSHLHLNRRSGKDRMHNITWLSSILSASPIAQINSSGQLLPLALILRDDKSGDCIV